MSRQTLTNYTTWQRSSYLRVKTLLAKQMRAYLVSTKDPREIGLTPEWDSYEYYHQVEKTPK